jgi:sugar fermentation stimulation protein A
LSAERTITVGRLGAVSFRAGYYAYVGSALNGLNRRLSRHLRQEKRLHWHIDYLLQQGQPTGIIACESRERTECLIARVIAERYAGVSGFGSSDCGCASHLFFGPEDMTAEIPGILEEAGFNPQKVKISRGEEG